MTSRPALRLRHARDAAFYAIAAAAALLVAVSVVQISRHAAAQRAATRQALQDKALDVAQMIVDHVTNGEAYLGAALLAPVHGARGVAVAPGAAPLTLAGVTRYAQERLDSALVADDSLFGLFRIDATAPRPSQAALETTGAARDPALRAVLFALLDKHWASFATPRVTPSVATRTLRGKPIRVHLAGERGPDGSTRAVYGVVLPRRSLTATLTADAVEHGPLLSATFYGHDWRTGARVARPPDGGPLRVRVGKTDMQNNGMLAVQVTDSAGGLLYETPRAGGVLATSRYAAEVLHPLFNIGVRVAFATSDGDRLVAAAVPHGREQLLMGGISLLGALFVVGAVFELRRQHQLAEDRRNFVAAVSHELRTPLAHLAVLSETLIGPSTQTEAQRRRWLAVIHREALQLGRLVENVLLHARGERHNIVLDRQWADAADVVHDVLTRMAPAAVTRRVTLRAAVPPPGATRAYVDPGALRHVLVNLVDNAVKYGPDGQTVTVAVTPAAPNDGGRVPGALRITVEDEGPGVPARDRRRVWQPFVRLGDRGGATGGSGLGLSVVRDLVTRHGGAVEVTAAPRGGARFIVTIPQPEA